MYDQKDQRDLIINGPIRPMHNQNQIYEMNSGKSFSRLHYNNPLRNE
jgi:hypothetical protein